MYILIILIKFIPVSLLSINICVCVRVCVKMIDS